MSSHAPFFSPILLSGCQDVFSFTRFPELFSHFRKRKKYLRIQIFISNICICGLYPFRQKLPLTFENTFVQSMNHGDHCFKVSMFICQLLERLILSFMICGTTNVLSFLVKPNVHFLYDIYLILLPCGCVREFAMVQ